MVTEMSSNSNHEIPKREQVSIGSRFGKLVVIEELTERIYKERGYLCQCDCGETTKAARSKLLLGRKKSCGCARKKSPPNTLDLIGKRFGKLIVLDRAGVTPRGNSLWKCQCDCGEVVPAAMGTSLRRKETISCGCANERMEAPRNKLANELSIDGVKVPFLKKKVRSDSISGHKGVHLRNRNGKITYETHIKVKGKSIYGATKKTLEDAIEERKRLEDKYHKPYIERLENKDI